MTAGKLPPEGRAALALLADALHGSLKGVYLHGSATQGGLRPDSDLDLLAVVSRPLARDVRRDLARALLRISGRHRAGDGTRPLEVAIFDEENLRAGLYPARIEFIYGEWLRESFEAGDIPSPHADPEYTLILAQAREQAVPVYGPELALFVPAVAAADIRRATADALPSLLSSLEGDEVNALLTLARMICTLETGNFVPKDVAAERVAGRLSPMAAQTLLKARHAYLSGAAGWRQSSDDVTLAAQELRREIEDVL